MNLSTTLYDIVIVGGGINGAGIARDAAGRGLKVLLVEREDLAQHTSSASTKLIHGGLRYLENFEFKLVRKALAERETLLNAAPHITRPLRFIMIHDDAIRSRWLVRAGLFLYDHLARRDRLPGSAAIKLARHPAGTVLQPQWKRAFEYSDAWVDDARLVVLNCIDAAERGATIVTRTACTAAQRDEDGWQIDLRDDKGIQTSVRSRALINATGPWVASFLRDAGQRPRHRVRLVRGSHIVVPRLFAHDSAYLFQNPDRRIVFAIPYEHDFTLIGTTETEHDAEASAVTISEDETAYLCATVSRFFRQSVTPDRVCWTYSGLRPLLDDEHAALSRNTRDYLLELDGEDAPLLSVFGGKITTYRKLAEEAVNRMQSLLGHDAPAWTARAPLPGGDMPKGHFALFQSALHASYPNMPLDYLQRLAGAYGTRSRDILGDAQDTSELGEEVLPGLFERELDYLVTHEWARSAQDILWRRSKLGLHLAPDAATQLDEWLRRKQM